MLVTGIFLISIAVFLVLWGLWSSIEQDLWDYMAASGVNFISTGALAVLMIGLYWKKAWRTAGAYTALSIGTLAVLGLSPVQKFFKLDQIL